MSRKKSPGTLYPGEEKRDISKNNKRKETREGGGNKKEVFFPMGGGSARKVLKKSLDIRIIREAKKKGS